MEEALVLAVDIGTSSVRAALYSRDGEARGLSQTHHEVLRPAPFMEEQNPDLVRDLVYKTMAACLARSAKDARNVAGLVFSSQMYSVFPVDAAGNPLHNSVIWSDGRAEKEAAELRGTDLSHALYHATGCPVNSIYPLAKILWFKRHCTERFANAARFVSIKDYVIHPLINDWVADHSMASGTGMFDLEKEKWADLALAATGLGEEKLPRLAYGIEAIPMRNGELARDLGLPNPVPVYLGGGDGPLANIGSGASRLGYVNIDLGTSGAMRVAVDRPLFDADERMWCYAMFPGRWAYGGIVTNVGNAMQWLGTNLAFHTGDVAPDVAATRIGDLANEAPAGSGGVLCLPYFRKARAPHWDDRLRGTLFGLTAGHDIRHISRAALEAIAYDLAAIRDIAAAHVPVASPIILTGGLSRNKLIPQLLADVMGIEVKTPAHCEGSLAGAAIMGLHGAGLLDGYGFERNAAAAGTVFTPRAAEAELYRSLRSSFAEMVKVAGNLNLPGQEMP